MIKPLSHLPIFSISLFLILSFSFLPVISDAWAATYYVDATNANDNNGGLSIEAAWETIAKVNGLRFNLWGQILFKRDQIGRGQHNPFSPGCGQRHLSIEDYNHRIAYEGK